MNASLISVYQLSNIRKLENFWFLRNSGILEFKV